LDVNTARGFVRVIVLLVSPKYGFPFTVNTDVDGLNVNFVVVTLSHAVYPVPTVNVG